MSSPKIKVNHYDVDPDRPHIIVKNAPNPELFMIIERACPASLYRHDSKGYYYDYTGCLECGTCSIIGGDDVFQVWQYPLDGYGIVYSL